MLDYSIIVQDVADEIRRGKELDKAITEVARDYDASSDVLRVRFNKAYPDGVLKAIDNKLAVEKVICDTCDRYCVPRSAAIPMLLKDGSKVTAICRTGRKIIAVRMDTGSVRILGEGWITNASLKYSNVA